VTIRVRTRDLFAPRQPASIGVQGFILVNPQARPGEGRAWRWEASFRTSRPHKVFFGILDAEHEESLGCFSRRNRPILRSELQFRNNVVFASFPRKCIAPEGSGIRPRWVRVSVSADAFLGRGREYDDAWLTPVNSSNDPDAVHYTPRLRPGSHHSSPCC
jgi:hypothetical protein